ncbi:unnamed protein product [Candidula unifasciata]|uniref:TNFR-Cys domain-containing protein n=1 Tax=Candidula unifasciata TaxID=100452 RepID=A0A8S3YY75_9EUPU|nr:unnamed protein product [Candidula unifasciata]
MMACYESCVDVGRRWSLAKDKIYCTSCGGLRRHLNLLSENTVKAAEDKPVAPVTKEERVEIKEEWADNKEFLPIYKSKECKCKQNCWEWILSFLGFGTKLPACCKRVPLTVWDSGEVARAVLVSKVREVVQGFRSRTKPQVRRTSQINLQEQLTEEEQAQQVVQVATSRKEYLKNYTTDHFSSASTASFDVDSNPAEVKRGKKHKHKKHKRPGSGTTPRISGNSQRSSDTHIGSRLAGAIAELKARSKPPVSSSSSEGDVKEEKDNAAKSFFNPFKNRSFVRKCSCPGKFRSFYCPPLPCVSRKSRSKSSLSRSRERGEKQTIRIQLSPKDQPSKQHRICKQLQPVSKCATGSNKSPSSSQKNSETPCQVKRDYKVIKSSSMPCSTCTSCFGASKPRSRFCRCDPDLSCGGPKLPCRSASFHSTLLRSPSPLAVVMPQISPCCRPCAVSTGRPRCRRFKCSSPLDGISRRSRSCSRPSCCCAIKSPYCSPPPLCKSSRERSSGPCVDKKSPCSLDSCHLGSKPPISLCPPCCTKPCCLPCPRRFTVFPYCQRIDATSKRYLSIPPCTMRAACPCPTGGPCSCPKAKHFPLPCCPYSPSPTCRVACSTPSAMSYIKSKQNDAICQRLLSRYGFSPPLCQNCPSPCYGGASEGLCGNLTPSCTSNFYSCAGTGSGGCRSCLP